MQLKRLERIVRIDGVVHYYWRFSDTPMIETPAKLIVQAGMKAKLLIDRRCSYGERVNHAQYVEYWGKQVSVRESYDVVNPRWSNN